MSRPLPLSRTVLTSTCRPASSSRRVRHNSMPLSGTCGRCVSPMCERRRLSIPYANAWSGSCRNSLSLCRFREFQPTIISRSAAFVPWSLPAKSVGAPGAPKEVRPVWGLPPSLAPGWHNNSILSTNVWLPSLPNLLWVKPEQYHRECGVANLMADMLRAHKDADVAVITASVAFDGPLPTGPLHRETLWNVCSSSANPGVVTMTGAQLEKVVARGLDPDLAKDSPQAFRGLARGFVHLSGACIRNGQLLVGNQPVESEREYRVAGSDWELEPYGGYVDPDWHLQPGYEAQTILREALEPYIVTHSPIRIQMGRLA